MLFIVGVRYRKYSTSKPDLWLMTVSSKSAGTNLLPTCLSSEERHAFISFFAYCTFAFLDQHRDNAKMSA